MAARPIQRRFAEDARGIQRRRARGGSISWCSVVSGNAKVRAKSNTRIFPTRIGPQPDALEPAKSPRAPRSGFEWPGRFHERMTRIASRGKRGSERLLCAAAIAAVLAVCFAPPVRADRKSEARDQFEHAVKMRTMLEGYLEKDRSLSDYRQTVSAYHKVYLISTQAEEVTPALVAEAELYQEMRRLFDPKYFQSAIDAYNFLLKQYPGSRYRGEAMLAIAQIQKDDLDKPADAEASYKEYLKRFPHSDKANEARQALKEIAGDINPPSVQPSV